MSTTFRYNRDPDQLHSIYGRPNDERNPTEHCYSRDTTHGSSRLEAILTSLLHAPCLTYSSGLSAFHALLVFLNPKVIAISDGYHGCHGVIRLLQRLTGCKQLPLDCNPEELSEGDLVCVETPINPTGRAFNIQHYADIAHSRGAYLMVDSTFGPPPLQDPFKHGADVVMHSGTKYIGGHSDMLCGVLAVERKDWLVKLHADRVFLGSVMGGLESWLGVRSIRTLELRVTRQSENARRIVDALDGALTGHTVGTGLSQSDVDATKAVLKEVHHASLQLTDYKTWLKKQMPNGFGPVFSIVMKSPELAKRLPSKLNFFHHATSLGGVESLIEWRTMTDATVGKDLLRVSVGIEDDRDLLDDLLQGFRALKAEL
jgi:cystathionine beta-lyase/cystathionine gamma-synthase